jgi:hypothetical protein
MFLEDGSLGSETEKYVQSHGQNGDLISLFPFLKKGNPAELMRGIVMYKVKDKILS